MTNHPVRLLHVSAIAFVLPFAGPSLAAGHSDEVFVIHGACSTMRMGARDVTRICNGKLISFTLANRRVGFIFSIGSEGILQFSGPGTKQVRLAGERASQPIDQVRFTLAETAPEAATTSRGSGRCTYGNPFAGTSKISCRVTSGKDVFAADFVTDGSAPESGGL